jgi:hypothetical protein
VIKVYRGLSDRAGLDRLKQCHDDYVAASMIWPSAWASISVAPA